VFFVRRLVAGGQAIMKSSHREFLQSSGLASIALAAKLAAPTMATADSHQTSFDINRAFASFMREIGGTPEDAGCKIVFTGQ
jgi:hypothetical protein